jgi:hypothetical protein
MKAIYTNVRDEREIPQIYFVATKDFDEEMPMISVWTKNRRIPNVLLDGGSGVNIITDTLMRKLGIVKQLEVAPFTIKMADQTKVTPLGIIKNLRIIIGWLTFKITVTVIKMENQENSYSMLLERPWLKQARLGKESTNFISKWNRCMYWYKSKTKTSGFIKTNQH